MQEQPAFFVPTKRYRDELTFNVNEKGVVDVDTVKGCTLGMKGRPQGCYDLCYAAKIAKFRGYDFTQSVSRRVLRKAQLKAIERAIVTSGIPFVRIGCMGDPSHDWTLTAYVSHLLARVARVVIVTKHWQTARDFHYAELAAARVVLNTSVSALDTEAERNHRLEQYHRYQEYGTSALRVVTCDFNPEHPTGARLRAVQDELLAESNIIDTPLRVTAGYGLLGSGVIRARRVMDLNGEALVSQHDSRVYLGNCKACPEQCGLSFEKGTA